MKIHFGNRPIRYDLSKYESDSNFKGLILGRYNDLIATISKR
jgi:hypothetical protein